jgi:hypothetical protein
MLHIFLMVFTNMTRLFLFYIVAVPFQILIVFWFILRKVK